MNILKIDSANVFRGTKKVLENFSLQLNQDEHTAIIGPNGAGKTTLLKLLAREIYPSGGELEIFGQSRWNVWELRKRLGIVSADLQTNYAAIALGRDVVLSGFYASIDIFGHQTFSTEQIETAKKTAAELNISHLSEKPFAKMSTGEQRRHLLARALVNQPEVLILDEPTSGLDLTGTFQYLATIRSLMKSGRTIVLVTHHIHEIPPEVERIVLLSDGKIVADGGKAEVLTAEHLETTFGVGVNVTESDGFYHVSPT